MKKDPSIRTIGKNKCTGCMACIDFCPYDGLELIIDEEGFFYPKANEKCVECGKCQNVCPVIQYDNNNNNNNRGIFYAGWSKNNDYHLNSSSGGIFPELADHFLSKKDIVYGVDYDDKLRARHIKIDDKKELKNIMKSKYIQSNMENVYKEIKNELNNGKKILYCGTPCQVAGLNKYIKHENLLTIDIICHGVPSNKIFDNYLEYIEINNKIKRICFRYKLHGWSNPYTKYEYINGKYKYIYYKNDPFFVGYLNNYYLRYSCYDCPFSKLPRLGDITLGDFWGVPKEYYNKDGVSIIIVNNEKGKRVIEKLKKEKKIDIKEVDKEIPIKNNPRIVSGKYTIPKEREMIMKEIDSNFKYKIKKFKLKPCFINYTFKIIKSFIIKKNICYKKKI